MATTPSPDIDLSTGRIQPVYADIVDMYAIVHIIVHIIVHMYVKSIYRLLLHAHADMEKKD